MTTFHLLCIFSVLLLQSYYLCITINFRPDLQVQTYFMRMTGLEENMFNLYIFYIIMTYRVPDSH